MRNRVFVGFSSNEMQATNIAEASIRGKALRGHPDLHRITRAMLYHEYIRPTLERDGQLWDVLSGAPMSTDHAIARFWIPRRCNYAGWALFTDGDVLLRKDINDLFDLCDDRYAVMCVQHPPLLGEGLKKDGAIQTTYLRKNWSSVVLFNCGHPANRALDLSILNRWPGRDLHAFAWLPFELIGAIPPAWNYLVNVSDPLDDPALVHFTEGVPSIPGHEADPFADEWWMWAKVAGYPDLKTQTLAKVAAGV